VRLEVIQPDPKEKNKYTVDEDYTLTRSTVPNEALRRFHRQMLGKAVESIDTQTPQEKIIGSETFAISEDVLEEANQLAEEFFQKMAQLRKKSKNPTQVYHLGVQFFNLTNGGKKK
jgi:uncharacterized protein (TIGR02147 family)